MWVYRLTRAGVLVLLFFVLPLLFLPQVSYYLNIEFRTFVNVHHRYLWNLPPMENASGQVGEGRVLYPFQNYDPNKPPTFQLRDDNKVYYVKVASSSCFVRGTDVAQSNQTCKCLPKWNGHDCSVPDTVWTSPKFKARWERNRITARTRRPRKVINAFNVNHELAMLEIRLNELYHVVDVFVLCESNYTALGQPKPLYLLPRLRAGFLREFQDKIVYVWLDHFPQGGIENGWVADEYLRSFLWKRGKTQLSGLRDDDLFILNDADEVPRADAVAFLKTHDGYGLPIAIRYRWTHYGFYWLNRRRFCQIYSVCTIQYLSKVHRDNPYKIRGMVVNRSDRRRYGEPIQPWTVGLVGDLYAGWHCSSCFTAEGIRLKMMPAQADDGTRWGNYPEKMDLKYITFLVNRGLWFDGSSGTTWVVVDNRTAPEFVLKNADRFPYLISPPGNRTSEKKDERPKVENGTDT